MFFLGGVADVVVLVVVAVAVLLLLLLVLFLLLFMLLLIWLLLCPDVVVLFDFYFVAAFSIGVVVVDFGGVGVADCC